MMMNPDRPWYQKSETAALLEHGAALEHGISQDESVRRRAEFGQNLMIDAKRRDGWTIFLRQFTDLMVLVLMVAAVIAGLLGEPQDAVAILAIIFLNAALGFYQEYRAERALEALQALAAPHARVRRSGVLQVLPAHELVPGDIVLL